MIIVIIKALKIGKFCLHIINISVRCLSNVSNVVVGFDAYRVLPIIAKLENVAASSLHPPYMQ